MQNGHHLQWLALRTVNDDVVWIPGDGPEKHGQWGDIRPFMPYEGVLGEPATGGDNFRLYTVGGFNAVFLNEPPDTVKVFGCLRGKLKERAHPRIFKRAARR